ncbi:tRNA-dependent cyclodipeptide synthase [Streptomyces sp. NPDC053474]|uniref:tRNA-dependent cyclodipeptide synthase n=1 Tax=Streptomyces sp. NPDC053474 TaxID=3365704 RepID=UPI0037CF2F45
MTAAGWPPERARRRGRRAVRVLRNSALRALDRSGVSVPERHVSSWTELACLPRYLQLREAMELAYHEDPAVRAACRRTAALAVQHAVGGQAPGPGQVDHAVPYALAELPVVLDGPALYGVETSVFVYHRPMDLLAPVITGEAVLLRSAPGQGYCVVTAQPPEVAPAPTDTAPVPGTHPLAGTGVVTP